MRMLVAIFSIASIVALGSGCNDGNSGNPLTPPPPTVALQAVVVGGPHRILPGPSSQFTATATYSDGTAKDVTHDVIWSSFDADPRTGVTPAHEVLQLDATGQAQSRTLGQAVVYARLDQRRSAAYEVLTYDEGTFAVWGSVTDDGNPLHASVEVVAGTRAGLFVWSNESKGFLLYGLSGPTTLRLSADGFEPRTWDVSIDKTGPLSGLELTPALKPTNIAGTWDVTFRAPSSCAAALGDALTTRLSSAVVTQSSTFLNYAWLPRESLAAFDSVGRVNDRQIRFSFSYDYGQEVYSWAERQPNGNYLAIDGAFEGTVTGEKVSGAFNGRFLLFSTYYDMWNDAPYRQCQGSDGSVTMTRRPT